MFNVLSVFVCNLYVFVMIKRLRYCDKLCIGMVRLIRWFKCNIYVFKYNINKYVLNFVYIVKEFWGLYFVCIMIFEKLNLVK